MDGVLVGVGSHKINYLCKPTSEYRIEIMYVYYIVMEIYVFVYINIFSPFYIYMYNYHAIIILLSWILHIHNYAKTFEN
jgi:hypothetical protein